MHWQWEGKGIPVEVKDDGLVFAYIILLVWVALITRKVFCDKCGTKWCFGDANWLPGKLLF